MHTKFWLNILKGRVHLEDLFIDGRIIFKRVLEIGYQFDMHFG